MPVSSLIPGTNASARAPRCLPWLLRSSALCLIVLLLPLTLAAADSGKLSEAQRTEIIRAFLAEHPFAHRSFPRGKTGVHIEGAKITPSEAELKQLIAQEGEAAKGGEHVKITAVRFERTGIYFEINGGPVQRKGWRDRIQVGVGDSGGQPLSGHPSDDINSTLNGSFVFLTIKDDATSFTTDHIKDLLSSVLDFKAKTVAEAYEKSLPPPVAQAIKKHHALVGMDKDMVGYAMGLPPQRIRDTADGQEYEEWIYGAPPKDVEFIRFVDGKVIRIEEMTVSGEKRVRTQNELDVACSGSTSGAPCGTLDASAPAHAPPDSMGAPSDQRRSAPTLLRPGESSPATNDAQRDPNTPPPPDLSPPTPSTPN